MPDARTALLEAAEKMQGALEISRASLKHREDEHEVCYDWCPRCRVEAPGKLDFPALLDAALQEAKQEALRGLLREAGITYGAGLPIEPSLEGGADLDGARPSGSAG